MIEVWTTFQRSTHFTTFYRPKDVETSTDARTASNDSGEYYTPTNSMQQSKRYHVHVEHIYDKPNCGVEIKSNTYEHFYECAN